MRLGRMVAVGVVALSTVVGACSHAFRQPEVTITDARPSLGTKGGVVFFDVAVRNPNHFTLRANHFTYDLRVLDPDSADKWVPVATGNFDQDVRIGSGQTTTVEVPISFDYKTGQTAVRSMMERGTLSYRVTGQVKVTEPLSRTVPYAHAGVVSLAGIR